MPTKAELQSSLTQRGISYHPSMKKDDLERRLEASAYKPTEITREQARSLTVATLKEILTIYGTSTKGLAKKEALVDAVVQLNPTIVTQEQQRVVETTERLREVPIDALRLAMERLSIPDQMRASIAFSDKTLVKEIHDKHIDIPNKVTIYDENKQKSIYVKNFKDDMTKEQIKTILGNSLNNNLVWNLKNNYLLVERSIVQDYGRYGYTGELKIKPLNSKGNTVLLIPHVLEGRQFYDIKYIFSFDTMEIDKIKEDMDYIRIGLQWIETYANINMVRPTPKKTIDVRFGNVPDILYNRRESLTMAKYIKILTKELKR